jgi:hypothetical protein
MGLGVSVLVLDGVGAVSVLSMAMFGGLCVYTGWLAVEMAVTRVEVGYDWIEKRAPFRRPRRVAFAEITGFVEARSPLRLGRHAFAFRVLTAAGPPLAFTSQLEGWAAIVQALHQSVPWRVPPAAQLYARRARPGRLLDPFSAALAAPGQPIPEERLSPRRIRWRDALLVHLGSAIALFSAAMGVMVLLPRSIIVRPWFGMVVVVVVVGGSQALTMFLVAALQRRRVARAQRDRIVSLDDAERVIPPGFAERQRRG